MKPILSLLLSAGLFLPGLTAQTGFLLRHPAINKNGSLVAFSYQGDIWTVPASGGAATRLTIHEAYESNPVFSPDGNRIAFSGARYGNNDVFVLPVEGGTPGRLTYHSASDNIASWTLKDQILFTSSREFRQIERPGEVFSISPEGGTEKRILDAVGHDPAYSPDGRFIVFVRGDINPVAREDYKGPSNRELWLFDTKTKAFSKLPGFATNDVFPQWGGNRMIYFLSSNTGVYNLYRMRIDDNGKVVGTPEQLTTEKEESIRHFNISADGATIVFEKDMHLYLMKAGKGSGQRINIQLKADERFDPVELKTLANGGGELALSPNGKLMAFAVRGEIFVKEADKEKNRSVNVSEHPFRDMAPVWLNDSTVLFSSDRSNGNFDLYLARSADKAEGNLFKSLKHEVVRMTSTPADESNPSISPDGKKIAYIRGRGALVVADIDSTGKMSNEKILHDSWDSPSGLAWSPDSKWVAYAVSDLYFNQEVFIHAADNSSKPVNVTMHPRTDGQPVWSADGSKLGFISARNNRNNDVWFVWLKKEDWEKSAQDWQEMDKPETPAPAKGGKQEAKPIKIDFENIHERLVQV
ncbi:MAG: PD40 domain-containing protein, partial [Haliscomenobacter sp.]|nr:PD40 domain-containing protein [Haliscomenobacter sp.]